MIQLDWLLGYARAWVQSYGRLAAVALAALLAVAAVLYLRHRTDATDRAAVTVADRLYDLRLWIRHHPRELKLAGVAILVTALAAFAAFRVFVAFGVFAIVIYMLFLFGYALFALLAYTLGDIIWPFISEPIAGALMTVGLSAHGPADFVEDTMDHYRLEPQDDTLEPRKFRSRVGLTSVGLTYDVDEEAFEAQTIDEENLRRITDDELSGDYVINSHRASRGSWVNLDANPSDVLVRIPDALEPLRNAAGIHVPLTQYMEELAESGGDQGGYSMVAMGILMLVFAAVGYGMGLVILT